MFSNDDKTQLLMQAKTSIQYGLEYCSCKKITNLDFPESLSKIQACFVTLHINNNLRGCIGSLNATQPLIIDLNNNAYAAAFEDPRFPKLTKLEFNKTNIDISVLSTSEEMNIINELDLLSQLRIGVDGLILEYQHHRATYLPSVWESLTTPGLFLNSLKEKAGLKSTFWSGEIKCYRYTTEIIKN